jgi:hypothetical protein
MTRPNRIPSGASPIFAYFAAILLFATIVLASDPPWKHKPYKDWDARDIERIFTDSPWTRTVTITRSWLPITAKDLPNEQLGGRDRGLPGTVDRSAETTVGGELELHVYWASSRVMRAASARKAILHGGKQDLDVEKYATETQDEYQIVLQSEDMAPFFRHDEKFFQGSAFLQPKKSKQKITPSHVQFERDAKGVFVASAIFFFPKKTASGDPTIPADEKNVEFNCKIEQSNVLVSFEPPKMVDANGLTF